MSFRRFCQPCWFQVQALPGERGWRGGGRDGDGLGRGERGGGERREREPEAEQPDWKVWNLLILSLLSCSTFKILRYIVKECCNIDFWNKLTAGDGRTVSGWELVSWQTDEAKRESSPRPTTSTVGSTCPGSWSTATTKTSNQTWSTATSKTLLTSPCDRLFLATLCLRPLNRFLNFWIEILQSNRILDIQRNHQLSGNGWEPVNVLVGAVRCNGDGSRGAREENWDGGFESGWWFLNIWGSRAFV